MFRKGFQTCGAHGLLDHLSGAPDRRSKWVATEVEEATLTHAGDAKPQIRRTRKVKHLTLTRDPIN